MNILFVNYGDFTSNSLNHIGAFANALIKKGHACIVAVPNAVDSLKVIPNPLFKAALFEELFAQPNLFPDGRSADIIHAWTPREVVRAFVISYQKLAHAKLIIHLEDNEDFLLATWLKTPLDELKEVPAHIIREKSILALIHPRRSRAFLKAADAATIITPSLSEFLPEGLPFLELSPGIDYSLESSLKKEPKLLSELSITENEKIIVLTGSTTFANESELRDLYLAVGLLNTKGIPTKLIRTGFTLEHFKESLPRSINQHVIELGFIDKARLPALLALADVLIQPGKPGPFNDYRLPSKLPEFLSSGRPVILPKTNIGLRLREGVDALLLKDGTPEEIAALCEKLFLDPILSRTLSENAVRFAQSHFNLTRVTEGLISFYTSVLEKGSEPYKTSSLSETEDEINLAAKALAHAVSSTPVFAQAKELASLVADLVSDLSYTTQDRNRLKEDALLSINHIKNVEENLGNFKRHAEALEIQSSERLKQIENLDIHLANFKSHAVALEIQSSERLKQIESLNLTIKAKNETLELTLNQLEESNAVLTQFKVFSELRKTELAAQVAAIEAEIEAKKRKIVAMENSFSWKFTAPLRFIQRAFTVSK